MALGHPHDGHRLRAAEHHLAVRMAVFLPSPDRLSGMDVPEGYPAVCAGCPGGDDGYLFCHAVYPQSVAAPALPHSDGCCAVLSGDAYCRCRHSEGVYGFREEENGKEVTLMGSYE